MNIVDFAYQVIEMQERITDLEMQNEQLSWFKEEYHKLMNSTMQHNQAMMGNIFKLCLTPGVIEACQEHATFTENTNV
jgi:hypothetical protein